MGKFDPRANLSLEQNNTVNKFIKRVQSNTKLSTKDLKFCDEACLCRYLRARDYNLDKAEKMLLNTLKWRNEYKVDEIVAQHLEFEGKSGKMYRRCKDKEGRPILYLTPANENSTDYKKNLQLVVYTIERAIACMDEGIEQMVWLIDFKGYTRKNSPPISVSKETLHILSNHYPERLGDGFLVDTPVIFNIFWKVVSPFIHPVTAKKIHFVKGKDKSKLLQEYVDLELVEKRFGGNLPNGMENDYWDKEVEQDLMRQKSLNIKYEGDCLSEKMKKFEEQNINEEELEEIDLD